MVERMKRLRYGVTATLLLIATVTMSITIPLSASAYAGGDGSDEDPWQISTCVQLQGMNDDSDYRNDSFVLTNNVNCTGVNFTRIMFGNNTSFRGVFDGAGYKISNLTVNNSTTSRNGLFGGLDGATVKNLTLENVTVSGEQSVGSLAGLANGGTYIENVTVLSGTVSAPVGVSSGYIGGLIGEFYETEIFNVIVDVDVSAPDASPVGGFAGNIQESTIGQAAALGNVEGGASVGGFAGSIGTNTSLDKTFATGNVISHGGPGGGLVGETTDSSYIGTYARGNVSGSGYLGGHTGQAGPGTVIGWAYATGTVTVEGESIGGGLVGGADESAEIQEDSFWDVQTSGMETSAGAGEVGKTTAEMKDMDTYIPFGWNFEDYWFQGDDVNDGYLCQIWYQVCYDAFAGGNTGGGSSLPNNGDGNNDGTIDEYQDNVVTILSPVSNKYVTVATDESCVLSDVSIADASSHSAKDAGFSYQSGFVNFTATGCDEDVANVKLYYHDVVSTGMIARKYNPTTNTYFTITSANIASAVSPLTGTVVSYAIADNSELDIDPTDGVIVDPVGLASAPGVPNTGAKHVAVLPIVALFAASIVTLGALIWYDRKDIDS